jgi:hypothetical protein
MMSSTRGARTWALPVIAPDGDRRSQSDAGGPWSITNPQSHWPLHAGTLQMQKDGKGLQVTIEPDPDISYARDIMLAVKRGDVSGMSFAFRTIEDAWDEDGPMAIRTVLDMRVSEVSVVTFPAYTQTDIQVAQRSLQDFRPSNGPFD